MKKQIRNIIDGIGDVLIPNFKNSFDRNEQDRVEVNYTRLVSAAITCLLLFAWFRGWITLDSALQFFIAIFNSSADVFTEPYHPY